MRPSAHRLLFLGLAETLQRDSFSRGGDLQGELHPAWVETALPGTNPMLGRQHPLQSCSLAPGHVSLLIFMKLSCRDHKIIIA